MPARRRRLSRACPPPCAFPTPAGPMSRVPSLAVLTRIAEETDLGDGVRIAGELGRSAPATTGW